MKCGVDMQTSNFTTIEQYPTKPDFCKYCFDEVEFSPDSSIVKANTVYNVHNVEWDTEK